MHNPLEQTNTRAQDYGDSLRRLPAELHPPYNWQEFQRRSHLSLESASGRTNRYVAAAAALLLVVCGIAIWGRVAVGPRHAGMEHWDSPQFAAHGSSALRGPAGDVDALRNTQGTWDEAAAKHNDAEAIAHEAVLTANRVRAIESWLATLPREPAVVRVGPRADVAQLEDNIAQVDDLLTSLRVDEGPRPDRLAALQKERTRLVRSLAQVRYAEVLASGSP